MSLQARVPRDNACSTETGASFTPTPTLSTDTHEFRNRANAYTVHQEQRSGVISNVFIFIRMYNPAVNFLLNAETKIGSLELPNLGSITSRSEILS
jgi:hypothetical protein